VPPTDSGHPDNLATLKGSQTKGAILWHDFRKQRMQATESDGPTQVDPASPSPRGPLPPACFREAFGPEITKL